jgi:hypothetical protein
VAGFKVMAISHRYPGATVAQKKGLKFSDDQRVHKDSIVNHVVANSDVQCPQRVALIELM